jgi:lauroyl/myristoyl acyltransferase
VPTGHHLYLFVCVLVVEAVRRSRSRAVVDGSARALGALAYRLSWRKRRRMEWGLARVFGPLAPAERRRIVRGGFDTFWDETLGFVPWRAARDPAIAIVGLEHLESARAAGRGAVLWESGYFGRRNIAKQALYGRGFAVHQVHDESHRAGFQGDRNRSWLRDRVVLPYFAACERQFIADVIEVPASKTLGFTRAIAGVLQRNEILCITSDVAKGQRLVRVPLCGEPKHFATGMVTLARQCGAPLIPLFCVRERDGRVRVVIEPAIDVPAGDDRDAAVATAVRDYAARLESYIRRYPDQYRSWHFPWWELG